ncbi:hypothetical protein [Kineosporia babensis]|uniref:Uncharacterized protein n=1 Tax=Kineosporia babensis TaxID=499548 RepID=A0A9X1SYE3_9ACTN|nr:hypothetical protein [Kineosporia babensis]MCD5310918.1 hypothetical protein [Kineosporia babensis]
MTEMQTDLGPIQEAPGEREAATAAVRRMAGDDCLDLLQALGLADYKREPGRRRGKPTKP